MRGILIAGIGNIFFGDDAFGVEVARVLAGRALPREAAVRDFGIRGYDLACALAEGYDAAILVDAVPRGEPPGTVYLMEADLANLGSGGHTSLDGHSLDPVRVLQMAGVFGGIPARIYVVGCEPGQLDAPEGRMGLSDAVQGAVPQAVAMIESLVQQLVTPEKMIGAGPVPA